jgi:hypothetical protein
LPAIALAKLRRHVLQLQQGAVGAAEQPLALRRERDTPVPPDKQPDLKLLFERPDLAADGRLGQAEVLGGLRDAHAPAHGDKALEQIEGNSRASGSDMTERMAVAGANGPITAWLAISCHACGAWQNARNVG